MLVFPNIIFCINILPLAILNILGLTTVIVQVALWLPSADGSHKATCTITVVSPNIFKIANGSIMIQNMILGNTNIKSAYIGSTQIFKKQEVNMEDNIIIEEEIVETMELAEEDTLGEPNEQKGENNENRR